MKTHFVFLGLALTVLFTCNACTKRIASSGTASAASSFRDVPSLASRQAASDERLVSSDNATRLAYRKVTGSNRRDVGHMFGGWGPHLRGLLTDPKGRRWMALDTGTDVNRDPAIDYLVLDDGRWRKAASQGLPATIQQNVASVISGRVIFSYGVNIASHWLAECYFDTETLARACNAITVSGRVLGSGLAANYVGAAVSALGTRVVWWTNVAGSGHSAAWRYIYNSGGGWNGPYGLGELGGYSDFAYVYASFKSPTEIAFSGQLYYGGIYAAGYAQLRLGNDSYVATPFRLASTHQRMDSSEDVYVDPAGDVHVLARTLGGRVAYFHKPWRGTWAHNPDADWEIEDAYRARFLPDGNGGVYVLVGGKNQSQSGLQLRHFAASEAGAALDWHAKPPARIDLAPLGFRWPSAIYVGSASYQTSALPRLPSFALCGSAWDKDNEIWQLDLDLPR